MAAPMVPEPVVEPAPALFCPSSTPTVAPSDDVKAKSNPRATRTLLRDVTIPLSNRDHRYSGDA
jgi:hypothetical protein